MGIGYNIGVLFADNSNSGLTHDYFAGILDSFKRTAEESGYDIGFLNCCKDGENRKTYLEQVKHRQYDGIVIACINYNDSEVTSIRLQSFREACAEIGAEIPEEYIKKSEYRDMKKAIYQTEQLLRLDNPPSCILYSDDFAAIGGINILRARGLEIPEDISVTGYDGINILSQYEPRLTTVRQNTTKIGQIAAEKLMEYIENPQQTAKETIIVETELEKGRTVGRVFY